MCPRVVDKPARQRELALLALALFARKGFDATSIREIAQAAGIAKGTIYEYFTSKEQIVVVAMETFMQSFEAQLQLLLDPALDPVEALQAIVRESIAAYRADPTLAVLISTGMQVLQRSQFQEQKDAVARLRKLIERWQAMLAEVLVRGSDLGVFLPDVGRDASAIALDLMAYMDGLGMYAIILGESLNIEAQAEAYMNRLIKALIP
jgi:AcrR family transcriptional regulator